MQQWAQTKTRQCPDWANYGRSWQREGKAAELARDGLQGIKGRIISKSTWRIAAATMVACEPYFMYVMMSWQPNTHTKPMSKVCIYFRQQNGLHRQDATACCILTSGMPHHDHRFGVVVRGQMRQQKIKLFTVVLQRLYAISSVRAAKQGLNQNKTFRCFSDQNHSDANIVSLIVTMMGAVQDKTEPCTYDLWSSATCGLSETGHIRHRTHVRKETINRLLAPETAFGSVASREMQKDKYCLQAL